jgi:tRNA(Arg) A34 adenosine deaminase TadA
MDCQQIIINIPFAVNEFVSKYITSDSDEDKMRFVIEASRATLSWEFGGPFAAAIFRADNHQLVALGVNLIIDQQLSTLHAEMVAIMLAQRRIKHFDLDREDLPPMELFTSTEPCTMYSLERYSTRR